MKEYVRKIKTDFRGYIFSNLRRKKYIINYSYHSKITYFILFLKKIKIGKKNKFFSLPYFHRYPESSINIGCSCVFDSSKLRNMIGVNKRCIIVTLRKNAILTVGNSNGFSGVRIGCAEKITIGNDCLFGANVTITDTDWHAIDPDKRKDAAATKTKPIQIGNNVFIGLNSIILKGTIIGNNSVIGAGSVVSGIIPPNVIVGGNPCKIIQNI